MGDFFKEKRDYRWRALNIQKTYIYRPHYIKSRKIFAKKIIYAIDQGREIINLDESSFNSKIYMKQGWEKNNSRIIKQT